MNTDLARFHRSRIRTCEIISFVSWRQSSARFGDLENFAWFGGLVCSFWRFVGAFIINLIGQFSSWHRDKNSARSGGCWRCAFEISLIPYWLFYSSPITTDRFEMSNDLWTGDGRLPIYANKRSLKAWVKHKQLTKLHYRTIIHINLQY